MTVNNDMHKKNDVQHKVKKCVESKEMSNLYSIYKCSWCQPSVSLLATTTVLALDVQAELWNV